MIKKAIISFVACNLLIISGCDNAVNSTSSNSTSSGTADIDDGYSQTNEYDAGNQQEEVIDSNPVVINGVNFDPPPSPSSRLNKRFGGRQRHYSSMINQISRRYGVEPYLTHAIISQESAYKPTVGSSAGAVGLMQLIPAAGRRFGCINRTNPTCNVTAGVKYLKYLARHFEGMGGNLQTIASGYNAGEGAAMSYLKGTRMAGKNPRGRKTPNGVPVASFALSKKQKASCSGRVNHSPIPRCEGQTYHYARNVAGYYLRYKRNPHIIGLVAPQKRASTCMERGQC